MTLSPEEALARALPSALNFYVLPPRVVEDPFWRERATGILAAIEGYRLVPEETVKVLRDAGQWIAATRHDRERHRGRRPERPHRKDRFRMTEPNPSTDSPLSYDEAVERVHRAFCDPVHELVGPWDEEMAAALRRNGYLIVKAERHFYAGDGESPCSEPCGGPEQGDPRHFTDGDA